MATAGKTRPTNGTRILGNSVALIKNFFSRFFFYFNDSMKISEKFNLVFRKKSFN